MEKVRAEAQQLIDEITEMQKLADGENSADMIARARAQMKVGVSKLQNLADPVASDKDGYRLPRKLIRGDTVRINGMNREGTVVGLPDGQGYCTVQTGIVKSKVHISELRLVENNMKKTTLSGGSVTKSIESTSRRAAASELDLRGMDVEQALLELDRYIDECVLLNLKTVSIIHGKGTGALRAAVQQALKKNKAVRSFRLGVYGEGENGVTIVELK